MYDRLIKFPNKRKYLENRNYTTWRIRSAARSPTWLINATEISFDGLWELVRGYDGVMFPAHIDKTANS